MPHPDARSSLRSNRELRDILRPRARAMRSNPTSSEALLWQAVRARRLGVKFRRQHPIGPFIVDFYAHEAALVVEIDGGVHTSADQRRRDHLRDRALEQGGLRVVRVPAWRVERDLASVLALLRALTAP